MTSGAQFSTAPSLVIRAPISVRGRMTRPIGRLESEASPVSRERKGCPARSPVRSRIVVPELPQSMSSAGALSCR